MNARELAEQIARDTSCAQGEFHSRVNAIIPYLTDPATEIERLLELVRGIGANRYWEGRWRDEKAEIERLRAALVRCRTVLGNMAEENENAFLGRRWPINHEPLRADARGLLPVIDEALGDEQSPGETK